FSHATANEYMSLAEENSRLPVNLDCTIAEALKAIRLRRRLSRGVRVAGHSFTPEGALSALEHLLLRERRRDRSAAGARIRIAPPKIKAPVHPVEVPLEAARARFRGLPRPMLVAEVADLCRRCGATGAEIDAVIKREREAGFVFAALPGGAE